MTRPLRVTPASSSQWRVSIRMARPASNSAVCRPISKSTARSKERNEFMFFISTLVPNGASGPGRTDTLASKRMEPSSSLASDKPSASTSSRSSWA